MTISGKALAIDYGSKRVGLAMTNLAARLPSPYKTIPNDEKLLCALLQTIKDEQITVIILGLPRGLKGQNTNQTEEVEKFNELLSKSTNLPIYLQDEALTSHKAELELNHRGRPYKKEDIDALAATYILEDWLIDQNETEN